MGESGPQKPKTAGDSINWEKLKETPEYKKFLLSYFKDELRKRLMPSDTNYRIAEGFPSRDDFETDEEYYEAVISYEGEQRMPLAEMEISHEIASLPSIEAAKEYCLSKGIDPEKIVADADQTYPAYSRMVAIKENKQ